MENWGTIFGKSSRPCACPVEQITPESYPADWTYCTCVEQPYSPLISTRVKVASSKLRCSQCGAVYLASIPRSFEG